MIDHVYQLWKADAANPISKFRVMGFRFCIINSFSIFWLPPSVCKRDDCWSPLPEIINISRNKQPLVTAASANISPSKIHKLPQKNTGDHDSWLNNEFVCRASLIVPIDSWHSTELQLGSSINWTISFYRFVTNRFCGLPTEYETGKGAASEKLRWMTASPKMTNP